MLVVPPSQDFKSHGDHGHSEVEPFSRHALHHSRDSQEHRNDRGQSEVVAHDTGHGSNVLAPGLPWINRRSIQARWVPFRDLSHWAHV
jgi:hypothetical protein